MTARRRRKSGSGPSATALIAWVEGTGFGPEYEGVLSAEHTQPIGSVAAAQAGERLPLIGRARGLAAGTLLACGSVLAVTVHAADSSSPPQAGSPHLVTVDPGAVSGGFAAAPAASSTATPPAVTRAQALGGPQVRAGAVPRNVPQHIEAPRVPSSRPQQQVPPSMSGAGQRQQDADRDSVEQAIAPVADPVTKAPNTVIGAVDNLITPQDRDLTSTDSVTGAAGQQAAPAAGALVEQALPRVQAPVENVLAPLQQVQDAVASPLRDVAALRDIATLRDVAGLQDGAQPAMTMLPPPG